MIGIVVMLACTGADKVEPDDTGAAGPGLVWSEETFPCDEVDQARIDWDVPDEPLAFMTAWRRSYSTEDGGLLEQVDVTSSFYGQPSYGTAIVACGSALNTNEVVISWAVWADEVPTSGPQMVWTEDVYDCADGGAWMAPEEEVAYLRAWSRDVAEDGTVLSQVPNQGCSAGGVDFEEIAVVSARLTEDGGGAQLVWTEDLPECEEDSSSWTVPDVPIAAASAWERRASLEAGEIVSQTDATEGIEYSLTAGDAVSLACEETQDERAFGAVYWATFAE